MKLLYYCFPPNNDITKNPNKQYKRIYRNIPLINDLPS